MPTIEINMKCPKCNSDKVVKNGKTVGGKQRYLCHNESCNHKSFLCEYQDIGRRLDIKIQILNMAVNGSGIRDTARVLKISPVTVISTIKKAEKGCSPTTGSNLPRSLNIA